MSGHSRGKKMAIKQMLQYTAINLVAEIFFIHFISEGKITLRQKPQNSKKIANVV